MTCTGMPTGATYSLLPLAEGVSYRMAMGGPTVLKSKANALEAAIRSVPARSREKVMTGLDETNAVRQERAPPKRRPREEQLIVPVRRQPGPWRPGAAGRRLRS